MRKTIICVLLAAFFAPPARAQEQNLSALTLEELLNVPIQVSALSGERPSDSAAAAQVITEETIRARGYATLLDLLEDVPQIELSHRASPEPSTVMTVQGLNGDDQFQIMVDGVRVTPVTGNMYALGRQFSLKNAKRVEIILGPVSALYGADAFTGVINIVTNPGGETGRSASASYGNYDTRSYSAAAGGSLGGAAIAVTADSYRSAGPFLPKYYAGDFSWYNTQFKAGQMHQFGSAVAVPFRGYSAPEEALFLHARLNLDNFEAGWIKMSETHSSSLGVKPDLSLYVRDALWDTRYDTLYGRHNYRSESESWGLETTFSRQIYGLDPRTKLINQYSGYQDAYKYSLDFSSLLEERFTYKITEKDLLLLGMSYQTHHSLARTEDLSRPFDPDVPADSQGFIYPGSGPNVSTTMPRGIPQDFYYLDYNNAGGYSQLQLNKEGDLQATLGLRFDRNSLYGDSVNPRAGLVWKPEDRSNIKLLYGEAFLAPAPDKTYQHFGSFYADTTTASGLRSAFMQIPNPDLKPEKMRSLQTEWRYRFTDSAWVTFSAYHSWVDDLFQSVTTGPGTFKEVPVGAIGIWTNRGSARAYGGTLRLDAKSGLGGLAVGSYAAYSYSGGDIAGDFLPYSSKGAVRAGLDISRGKWSVSPRLIWQSRSYNKNRDAQGRLQSSDPFAVVDLYAKYGAIARSSAGLSVFLDVKNLLNARYDNPGRADDAGFGATPQAPISASAGMTFEF